MMYANPGSLKDLCIDFVCDNFECFYMAKQHKQDDQLPLEPEYTFIEHDAYLPREVAEILLTKLSLQNKITNEILSVFNHKSVYLRNVILPKAKNVTTKGIRLLKKHKIKNLEARGLNCTINELVGSLGEWTIQNLETLCVSNGFICMFNDPDLRINGANSLSKLKNLRSLDVTSTEFNTNNLITVVEDLPYLESLDISNTKIDTLLPLMKKKNQLQRLSLYNLNKVTLHINAIFSLKCMTPLTHLDLSSEKHFYPFESLISDSPWLQLLTDPDWMPNLVSLDLSGSSSAGPRIMEDFLTTHKKLRFLGLMYMDDSGLAMFTTPTHPLYNPDLVVTGVVTQEQILAGLKCYTKRPTYIENCLYHLYKWTENYDSPKVDIIQLILNVVNCFTENVSVQSSANVCLYYLTKSDLASKIHPCILSNVVKVTLDAMERFSHHNQFQKNMLITLHSDHILKNVKMDNFRCTKLVLDALHDFGDTDINSLSVAICSKLTAKMSTYETSQLGSNPKYIAKLLGLVCGFLASRIVDDTLKFTLITLWNITDGSPKTCEVFIEEGGLELYLKILDNFINDSSVKTNVLGLINNIAEVPYLRNKLLENKSLIPNLRRLLRSAQIDVSYSAAGIIAHLVCEPAWQLYHRRCKKRKILEELRYAVKQWVPPMGPMITYQSFLPFIGLLNSTDTPEVQLWAAWAILHVCTTNAKIYCAMLNKENGCEILQRITSNKMVDPEVCEICYRILDLINEFKNVSNPVLPMDTC